MNYTARFYTVKVSMKEILFLQIRKMKVSPNCSLLSTVFKVTRKHLTLWVFFSNFSWKYTINTCRFNKECMQTFCILLSLCCWHHCCRGSPRRHGSHWCSCYCHWSDTGRCLGGSRLRLDRNGLGLHCSWAWGNWSNIGSFWGLWGGGAGPVSGCGNCGSWDVDLWLGCASFLVHVYLVL